jgi:acyl carrier protein
MTAVSREDDASRRGAREPSEAQRGVSRDDVVAMLATYGDRTPDQVREKIDSLELAWLVHQVEQRFGVSLDLEDDSLIAMSTVDGAVKVLGDALA